MPKNVSTNLKREKNRLDSTGAWLLTIDLTLPDATTRYLVRNNEDIVFQGQTYAKANFQVEGVQEDAKGAISQVQLRVADITQALEYDLQAQGGGLGSTVLLRVINTAYLAENYADLELSLEVMRCTSKAGWITWTLSIPNPYRKRFPLLKTRGDYCNWVRWYKGAECGYTGALATCKGTLEDCRAHNNSARFGGQPGLVGGLRIA